MADSSLGQEIYKMSLKHLVKPDSKEAFRLLESHQKDFRVNLKRFQLAKDGIIWTPIMIISAIY